VHISRSHVRRDGRGEYVHGAAPEARHSESGALGSASAKVCHCRSRFVLHIPGVSVLSLGFDG
jgi:hypothetical protein